MAKDLPTIKYRIEEGYIDKNNHLGSEYFGVLFKNARLDVQETFGLSDGSIREDYGVALMAEKENRIYGKEVFLGQTVEICTRYTKVGKIRMNIDQEMFCEGGLVASNQTNVFFKNLKTGKLVFPPEKFLDDLVS